MLDAWASTKFSSGFTKIPMLTSFYRDDGIPLDDNININNIIILFKRVFIRAQIGLAGARKIIYSNYVHYCVIIM